MSGAFELEAARALLTLREILVRHDENQKAHTLMQDCVPYVIEHRRDVIAAREDQAAMTLHLRDEQAMRAYYGANPHDRPFEEQYGLPDAVAALDAIPRFGLLRDQLPADARVLDLACNDGILAAALRDARPDVLVDGVDLGEACIERANARGLPGRFVCGDLHTLYQYELTDGTPLPTWSDVVLFEVIEHVADPLHTLDCAADRVEPGGSLWVSTPVGAVEKGELPAWDVVEPKGHVRAYSPAGFVAGLSSVGTVKDLVGLSDGTMVGRVTVG